MRTGLVRSAGRIALLVCFILVVLATVIRGIAPTSAAIAQGDGMMVYGEGAVTTPRTRTWTQATTTWGSEDSAPAAAATIRQVIVKASPTRNEMIMGVQASGGVLYVQRWDGSSWSNEWNVTVGNGNLPRFDIAYEHNSGEALVVYGANAASTNELRYRRWNGATWTAEANLDAVRTSGVIQGVRLKAHAGTLNDDIALAWVDANLDLSANYWTGASNSWATEPASALSTNVAVVSSAGAPTNWCFDVALESTSGDMLVAWGNNTVQDLLHTTRGTGGTWGAIDTNTDAFEEPTDLDLASDPHSDYIAYANITDNTTGADAALWTGSAWNGFNNFDTTTGTVTAGTKNIAVSWLRSGAQDRAVVAYEDTSASGVDWLFYNKNTDTWSAPQSDFTAAPAPAANVTTQRMVTNPFNASEAMLTVVDSASDTFAKRLTFDGTDFTWSSSEPGGAALELTASAINGFSADFDYARFIPGGLGVDIVDGSGDSVANPGVSMSTADVSLNCQTTTGTFGTASQKIRLNNNSATPGWTLTLAATDGASAAWTAAGEQYDYNDSSGTPPGCGDGGDADAYAGQFSINPAGATLTPAAGCPASGINLGGPASFAQGSLDNLTLATASSIAAVNCYWDITGVGVSQQLPGEKPTGNYTINLTLTATSN